MNRGYRLVWNNATQRYVAAPESARGRGKNRAARTLAPALLLGALLALPAFAQAPAPSALPAGAQVAPEQARIRVNGKEMTIDQASPRAILHWKSFDIGSEAKVRFNQPDANAIALNRVLGSTASQIDGHLSANGQVWLVNPNGVVFGKDSKVDVGGLVASTLDITDADFNAGRRVFTRAEKAQGSITNQGVIDAKDGGLVALLAPKVQNEGLIRAQLGNMVLAGGDKVTLKAGVDGRLEVAVDPAMVSTLIENKRMIIADGGQVVMTASTADALSGSMVANTGTVQAHTLAESGGRIQLLANMQRGEVMHSGLLDASAPHGGHGGSVETRAAKLTLPDGHDVTTHASDGNLTGSWLINSNQFTIAPREGNISGAELFNDLKHSNVTIASQDSAAGHGDIHFNDNLSWSHNTLTLQAARNININAVMTASDKAQLDMNYGGYSASDPQVAPDSGVHVALMPDGFAGRVNFIGTRSDGSSSNVLRINGEKYTILTRLVGADSSTGQDLQGMRQDLAGKYALGADIDAEATKGWNEGAGFMPIGTTDAPFTGTFEGAGPQDLRTVH